MESVEIQTAIGAVKWSPDANALEDLLLRTVREAVEVAGAQSIVASYFQFFLAANIEHAARQAAAELVALAKATASRDKHERDRFARDAADIAKDASLDRLRYTGCFPRSSRGTKKDPTAAERMLGLFTEQEMFLINLKNAITTRLREGKRPTLSNVAALMNMGSAATGGKMLGRELRKWVNRDAAPKKILVDLTEEIKNRTFEG